MTALSIWTTFFNDELPIMPGSFAAQRTFDAVTPLIDLVSRIRVVGHENG